MSPALKQIGLVRVQHAGTLRPRLRHGRGRGVRIFAHRPATEVQLRGAHALTDALLPQRLHPRIACLPALLTLLPPSRRLALGSGWRRRR